MNKVAIIDFDGCLCSVNSFRFWVIFSFIILFVTLRWRALVKFGYVVLARMWGKVDRVEMKRVILSVTEDLPSWSVGLFCRFLYLLTNTTVSNMISSDYFKGIPVVLCTAAPACYVRLYAQRFSFSQVMATPTVKCNDWKENFGAQKLKALIQHYGEDVNIHAVVTDHHDDLPLLEKAEKCYLVRPSADTLEALRERFKFEVLE